MIDALRPSPVRNTALLLMISSLVILYVPVGKNTVPPPAALTAAIAFWIAMVSSVVPSPLAPKSLTLEVSRSLACTLVVIAPVPEGVYTIPASREKAFRLWHPINTRQAR